MKKSFTLLAAAAFAAGAAHAGPVLERIKGSGKIVVAHRESSVPFSYVTGARYMVRADSPIAELPQFEDRKLASTKGTTPLKAISQANRERLLRIQVLEADDHARAVEMVKRGEADPNRSPSC